MWRSGLWQHNTCLDNTHENNTHQYISRPTQYIMSSCPVSTSFLFSDTPHIHIHSTVKHFASFQFVYHVYFYYFRSFYTQFSFIQQQQHTCKKLLTVHKMNHKKTTRVHVHPHTFTESVILNLSKLCVRVSVNKKKWFSHFSFCDSLEFFIHVFETGQWFTNSLTILWPWHSMAVSVKKSSFQLSGVEKCFDENDKWW